MAYDEELAQRIRDMLESEPDITERTMFGGLAFFVTGNMAVTATGEGGLLLRADPSEVADLCEKPGVEPAVMKGRIMSGWIRVPVNQIANEGELRNWVDVGTKYARTLPPK